MTPIAIASLGMAFLAPALDDSATVGSPAPAFTLTDTLGQERSLADYKGKYVVLEWTNHLCPYVQRHYGSGNMQATQAWAVEKGAVWLTIVSSAPGKQGYVDASAGNEVVQKHGAKSTAMLLDPTGRTGKLYGAKTTPDMFVINPEGTLIYRGAIDDKPDAPQTETKNARNHVKAALEEAMAGREVSVKTTQPYGCSVKYAN
ncbi:MAG: thioredoxin family protein [Fimbriimonadaceae bacterium]|nr:thioredoxin family protein [Fimbriimonadaceae bacterium]QYK55869.1 MAG: thioredoxin family protein [Fimbriimonadaceae bacterium]